MVAQADQRDFAIPAQPLGQALTQFGIQTDYRVLYNADVTEGRSTRGVSGRYSAEEALARLLEGTGVTYTKTNPNEITLHTMEPSGATAANGPKDEESVEAREVVVKSVREWGKFKPLGEEATAEDGYRPETVTSVGPFDRRKIEDTPYSISVVPSEMIKNLQMSRNDQLFRINPLTQTTSLQNMNNIANNVNIRGFFLLPNSQLQDGFRTSTAYGVSLEEMERVEIFSGLTGFLYGGGTVGGLVNYVLKRPTPEHMANLTVGNYGGSQYYAHGDFGGPIDSKGKFGYRVNLFYQDGDTPIESQHLRRNLASVAFDWHITNRMLLQVDGSHQDYDITGQQVLNWTVPVGVTRPDLPGDKLFGQPWSSNHTETNKGGIKLTWDISDVFTFRAGYRYQQDSRTFIGNAANTIQANGTYSQFISRWAPNTYVNHSVYAFLDSKFRLFNIVNKVTAGVSGYRYYNVLHRDNASFLTLTGLTFDNPFRPQPVFPPNGIQQSWAPIKQGIENVTLGDEIIFNEQWSAIAGVNWTTIKDFSGFNTASPSDYNKSAWTPTGSIIYKPLPWLSTYATYMEALEAGQIVAPGFANAGTVFPPLISRQYEVGAKARLGKMLLTGALFRIEKANQFSNLAVPIPTFVQDGRQVNEGIELTAVGKATDDLTLYGGVTLMDITVKKAADPNLEGKRPTDVANQMVKLYAEYNVPFLRALTLTGGVFWIGDQAADTANTTRAFSI